MRERDASYEYNGGTSPYERSDYEETGRRSFLENYLDEHHGLEDFNPNGYKG